MSRPDTNLPQLLIDASGPGLRVGVLQEGRWLDYRTSDANALEGLFAAVDGSLRESGIPWEGLDRILFCRGPGSLLSLRVAAMAVKVWYQTTPGLRPPLSFPLLETCARSIGCHDQTVPLYLAAPGRRGEWHLVTWPVGAHEPTTATMVPTGELEGITNGTGRRLWIPHRELGDDLGPGWERVSPDWSRHPDLFTNPDVLSPASLDALVEHRNATDYIRWSGQIHQRPQPS